MAKRIIAVLKGRQLELVGQAGDRLVRSLQEFEEARNRVLELERTLQEAIEIATGDRNPASLSLDRDTGEVFREVKTNIGRTKKRATTKGKKKTPKGGE